MHCILYYCKNRCEKYHITEKSLFFFNDNTLTSRYQILIKVYLKFY